VSTIVTDYQGFKQLASDYFKLLPTAKNVEQIQSGTKCLLIAYFGMTGTESQLHEARIILDLAESKGNARELQILLRPLQL
jgi:hypothetical protein